MSRAGDRDEAREAGSRADQEALDASRFVRGLTIGLIVGAVIAGSTLWRRFGTLRHRP